ncbi:putative fatty acyl-CoA reductase CG5065 [Agrilus planipennis]|uniref:Fatty acyl-CoA reductase n=1 Tax=Agrilus planipennis TaxID=224129 RepID=A0A7F5RN99_AGRPL|nr:putative fatty acyl-CoA reductase CG5065 [Agrilus planipennis]
MSPIWSDVISEPKPLTIEDIFLEETMGAPKQLHKKQPFIEINNNSMKDVSMNNIAEFYKDTTIFITGGTGFVGKALLEKLLRTCYQLDKVYLLVRPKKGNQGDQRLKELIANPVFDRIREKNPEIFSKIYLIPGDMSQPGLGLSANDRNTLIQQVNLVFHSAATVRFHENLKDALTLNTLATKRVLDVCKAMRNLKCFIHVSTAYSNADKRDIQEIVYNPTRDPEALLNCIDALPENILDEITDKLIGDHPNTYTFTKSLAEKIVLEYSEYIPCAIVRPSIVTASWKEPFPGWVDNVSGITGIMLEVSRGTIKSIICKEDLVVDLIPVDVVANTLITAAWHTTAYRSNSMRVYNCTTGQISPVSWKKYGTITECYSLQYPTKYVTLYPGFTYRTNRILHRMIQTVVQTIPAYIFDHLCIFTKRKRMMVKACRLFQRMAKTGEFFSLHEFNFHTPTFQSLLDAVENSEDGADFTVDMRPEGGFSWDPYVKNYLLGIRKYILKDDLSSLPQAKAKLSRLYWAGKILQAVSMYFVLRLALW